MRCIYRYRRQWGARRACARDVRCFVRIDSRERGIVLFCVRSHVRSRAGLLIALSRIRSLRVGRVGVRRLFDFIHTFAYITAASFPQTTSDKERRGRLRPSVVHPDTWTHDVVNYRRPYIIHMRASIAFTPRRLAPHCSTSQTPLAKGRNDRDRRSCHSSPRCGTARLSVSKTNERSRPTTPPTYHAVDVHARDDTNHPAQPHASPSRRAASTVHDWRRTNTGGAWDLREERLVPPWHWAASRLECIWIARHSSRDGGRDGSIKYRTRGKDNRRPDSSLPPRRPIATASRPVVALVIRWGRLGCDRCHASTK